MKFFTRNLSIHLKRCQNFQTKNILKELVLAKISRIPQLSHVILSFRWIKVKVLIKKSSEKILCKHTMFELQLKNKYLQMSCVHTHSFMSLSNNSLKVAFLSLYTARSYLSCILFILLFNVLE